jgi:hypothetical protein
VTTAAPSHFAACYVNHLVRRRTPAHRPRGT